MENYLRNAEKIVIKVGTSTLTYGNGKMNLRLLESLCKTISDLQNSGKQIILVSSGAIGVGMGKLGLKKRPNETAKKQALAAVGQCELMFMYDKLFGEYNCTVAQVLLTADAIDHPRSKKNVQNTFCELLEMSIIPVV
ncbi:MAG: glutamate 5-kinase, partial [Oscillospiraceae bacterium]